MKKTIEVTSRQLDFIDAAADEVLFGGAAGGGKSFGQLIDALVFAVRYEGSKQLILRRTMPELEHSLILGMRSIYPAQIYAYKDKNHCVQFCNGSTIEFGYCANDGDVYRYQSAEYDVIRFDELTHFSESIYLYLMSRLRGVNGFPKQMKSTTNPGGEGHEWVKRRFIDSMEPNTVTLFGEMTRVFLPAFLADNSFLLKNDRKYAKRLQNLPPQQRKALLKGEWDINEGRYFDEFTREVHTVKPFEIPGDWQRYFAMDYGLDMLAGYWIALDTHQRAYVYREIYEPNHIISSAAKRILEMCDEEVAAFIAPADLWSKRQETGKSAAQIFCEYGIALSKCDCARVSGWYTLKEWLSPFIDETGKRTARLVIFENCRNLIRCLPALLRDERKPNDCARTPHELTHAPDAIRYFVSSVAEKKQGEAGAGDGDIADQLNNLLAFK
ncbi:MAG: phage terminase large subunit [Oscillospiraceae bacterium]